MKVGFTASCFDLLHSGHIDMLRQAKSVCDYLVVGLQVDPTVDRPSKNQPVQSISERFLQLDAVKFIDQIIPYSTERELIDLILLVNPDIRILGKEYEGKQFTGSHIKMDYFFNERKHEYSTSSLRKRVKES
jgi:glycerol-3-phosphate cytidylyltransferase